MNEYVLKNFQFYHRSLATQMVGCYETKFGEIVVELTGGRKVLYNDFDQSARFLPVEGYELTEEEILEEFSNRLRYLMRLRRITQRDLSEMTGLTQPAISKYVSGRTMPNMHSLYKLSRALDCSVDDLMYVD